jgi:hypothetical protein
LRLGNTLRFVGPANQASWANLSALQAGQKIQIVEMNSNKHSGTFVGFSDTAMSYQESAGEQTIRKQNVRSVKLMKNKHRLRNTLVLGGAGAGVGAGIGAATYPPCSSPSFCLDIGGRALPTAIGAAVGFVGGRCRRSSVAQPQNDLPREFATACFGSLTR